MPTITLQRYTPIENLLRAIVAAAPDCDPALGPGLKDDAGEVTLGQTRMPRPGDARLARRFVAGTARLDLACEPKTVMTRDGDELDMSGYVIELRSPAARLEYRGLDAASDVVCEAPDGVVERVLDALGERLGSYPCAALAATPPTWKARALELGLGGPGMRVLLTERAECRILVFPEGPRAFGVLFSSDQAIVAPLGPMPRFEAPVTQVGGTLAEAPLERLDPLDDIASIASVVGLDRDALHAREDESFLLPSGPFGRERRFHLDHVGHMQPRGQVRASYARAGDVHLRWARVDHEFGRASISFVVQDERGDSLVACHIAPGEPSRRWIRIRTHGARDWTEALLRALPPIS